MRCRIGLLEFAAAHPMVLASQIALLLAIGEADALQLVGALVGAGWLRRGPRLRHQSPSFQITQSGLAAIGSDLPPPEVDVRRYWQDLDAVWLSVGAENGLLPEFDRYFTRRQMRLADAEISNSLADVELPEALRAKAAAATSAITMPDPVDPSREVEHYSDLSLVLPQGRVAIELVRTLHSPEHLRAMTDAYAAKPSVQRLLFLSGRDCVSETIIAAPAPARTGKFRMVQRTKVTPGGR